MRFFSYFLIVAGFFLITAAPALAQGAQDGQKYVKIRLLPERGEIKAGQEIWIGVEQSIHPGWHTYWKNPGDSGSMPRVDWTLPEGFEISDIHWPAPQKLPYGPLLNYGYEKNVILLQKLKAPDRIPEGEITLMADIEVLVCEEICIPEFGTYEMSLNGPMAGQENNAVYLAEARGKLPGIMDWDVSHEEEDGNLVLTFELPGDMDTEAINLETAEFYPANWGTLNNVAKPESRIEGQSLILKQERGGRPLNAIDNFGGVLSFEINGIRKAYAFSSGPENPILSTLPDTSAAETASDTRLAAAGTTTVWQALILALLGGVILNLMPCVFPVLSIKALSLVKISEKDPGLARLHGIAYTLGVILSFLIIAGILITLKTAGSQVGWGFQLQNPLVVTLLAYLLFVIGLNLSGFFEIRGHFGNFGNKLAQGNDLSNSFATGILATLVATPCTAPFMAAALGFALVQPALVNLTVFAFLGLGLALPYLVLSFIPNLQRILPKPGTWMEVFRQILAFPMFASAAWLVWVVSQQAGPMAVLGALMGMVILAFALWLYKQEPASAKWKNITRIFLVAALLAAIFMLPRSSSNIPTAASSGGEYSFGETFSPAKLAELLKTDDPVFVEMTAAWCITCKVNHAVAINTDSTQALFEKQNVRYLIGDWTNQDPQITAYLNSFGRNGVPIYVYYGPRNAKTGERPDPALLPQVLTPGIVKKYVKGG